MQVNDRDLQVDRFHDHLEEFDEWEEVDLEYANGEVVYAPVLDPTADSAGIGPGPRPPMGKQLARRCQHSRKASQGEYSLPG